MKTCRDCGERVYNLGCTNCNEMAYIDEQERLNNLYGSDDPKRKPEPYPPFDGTDVMDGDEDRP